jgi:serine/threonine protein kinase
VYDSPQQFINFVQLGGTPETDARWFFQQFIIAVDYCHRLGIANRDIKVKFDPVYR